MTQLPEQIYLSRQTVLAAVGGRRQLERLESQKRITRHHLPGYTRARYLRAEIKRVLDDLGGPSS